MQNAMENTKAAPTLILASGSPRRRELMQQMGLNFTVVVSDVDESAEPMAPDALVQLLSRRKAEAVAALHPEEIVIAADTVVALGNTILGKPRDEADARRMLELLSGRSHEVFTGMTVCRGGQRVTCAERTAVHFRPLNEAEIDRYIATGEPMDKAGAYAVQGLGGLFVTGLEGDCYNVIGLPICRLGQILEQLGVTVL